MISDKVKVELSRSAWAKNKTVDGVSLWGLVGTVLWKFELRPCKLMRDICINQRNCNIERSVRMCLFKCDIISQGISMSLHTVSAPED